ncbi:hypothetical protein F5883DRAFT_536828 [Diaporthe sp. PMI_573]|nr:hypothetical protein F5883DRAFT_536828 [Diaporthaceae sp. PMI_573]
MAEPQLSPMQSSGWTIRTQAPDLNSGFGHVTGSDTVSSFSSNCDHLDDSESIANHDNESQITKSTEVTPADGDVYDVDGAPLPADLHCCINQDQEQHNPLLQAEICNGQGQVVHGARVDDKALSDGNLANNASGFTHLSELESGCYDQEIRASTMEASDLQPTKDSSLLYAAWKDPDESNVELQELLESAGLLLNSARSRDTPEPNQHSACRLSTPPVDNSMPAAHFCATEDGSSPCASNSAREIQVHVFDKKIHRLMPADGIIGFKVNRDSFQRGNISDEVTDLVISAAKEVASVINAEGLGISFDYRPNSASNVFDICYDPSLKLKTLARSFFPSDLPDLWALRISRSGVSSEYSKHLFNILAHEFAHILGLRHWNAGLVETDEESVHVPDTESGSKDSVMITGVHPKEIRFFDEDFHVIREIYKRENGGAFAGREIVDVYPNNGSWVLSRGLHYVYSSLFLLF